MTSKPNSVNIPAEDLGRQAVQSLGGYIYQLYQTVAAWLRLSDDGVLAIEVAEDYALLIRDVIEQVQVKKTAENVTLRNEGVLSLIDSHLRLQKANPTKQISSVFLTTSNPGHEQGVSFPDGLSGLEYWNLAAEQRADVEPIRQFLPQLELSSETKDFLTTASSDELKTGLVEGIKWLYSADQFESVRQSIRDALVTLGHSKDVPSNEAEEVEYPLIGELMQLILSDGNREVNKADLLRVFDRATAVTIPRAMLKKILSGSNLGSTDSPTVLSSRSPVCKVNEVPFAPRIASRKVIVSNLSDSASQKSCVWVYGSTGLGKTTLALLAAQRQTSQWRFVDLRKCNSDETKGRLEAAAMHLQQEDLVGVILDDYPVRHIASTLLSLVQLVSFARARNVAVIITSAHAATPEVQTRIGQTDIEVLEAPYLTEEDVGELVEGAGGDANVWAKVIHAFTGGGHPQLVDARVLGLSDRGWPQEELVRELIPGLGKPEEIRAQFDAAFVRLSEELPEHSRRLLYRLSLCLGAFDRELALALAEVQPESELPGESLQHLLGPWIEGRGEDRFAVSPLVSDSGSRNLSKSEQSTVRKAITYNLIQRSPFPGDQLSQLLFSAFAEQSKPGLRWFTGAMLQYVVSDKETFSLMAQGVSVFALFRLDHPLCPADPYLSAMLRMVQFFVALETEPDKFGAIFDKAVEECRGLEDPVLSSSLLILLVSKTLMRRDGVLRPKQWLPLVADFPKLLEQSGAAGEGLYRTFSESEDSVGWTPEQFLFVCHASSLPDIDTLTELFEALDKLDTEQRNNLLDALDKDFRGRRLMMDNPWANEGKHGSMDGFAAASKYVRTAQFASRWDRGDLEMDCICAQAVLLDEYADGGVQALSVLEQGIAKHGATDRLLHRRQVVLYGQGRHKESLEVFPDIVTALNDDSIDRVYALRYAGISAVEVGDLVRASLFFMEAAHTAKQPREPMFAMAAGLLGDCAIVEFRQGNFEKALIIAADAVRQAEQLDPNDGRRERYCSIILGHLLVCLWQDAQKAAPERHLLGIRPGDCSNQNPAKELLERPLSPHLSKWYLLALAETLLALDVDATKELRKRTANGGYFAFELLLNEAIIASASKKGDLDTFLNTLPSYLEVMAVMANDPPDDDLANPIKFAVIPVPIDRWNEDRYFVHFAEAVLAFALCAVCRDQPQEVETLVRSLERQLQAESTAVEFLEIFINDCSWPSRGKLQYLGADCIAVARTAKHGITAENVLRVTYYVWGWLRRCRFKEHLENEVADFVSELWQKVITDGRFMLVTPNLSVPSIEAVLEGTSLGTTRLAALALAGARATSAPLTSDMCAELQSFLESERLSIEVTSGHGPRA